MTRSTSATRGFVLSRKQQYIEEVGAINEQMEELKARKELLCAKLEKFTGKTQGVSFYLNVFTRNQTNLDKAKVKRMLGEVKYAKCLTSHEVTIVSVKRLTTTGDNE